LLKNKQESFEQDNKKIKHGFKSPISRINQKAAKRHAFMPFLFQKFTLILNSIL